MSKSVKSLIAFSAVIFVIGGAQAEPTYMVTDLGTLGSPYSTPQGINGSGQVVGYSTLAGNAPPDRATLFSATGAPTDLSTFGSGSSYAMSINDAGQVVGYVLTASSDPRATLFSTSGAPNTDLGTLGGTRSTANAINESGQIVGEAYTVGDAAFRATLFGASQGFNIDLGTLGGNYSSAYDISGSGLIIGFSYLLGDISMRATLFDTSGGSNVDLGLLEGSFSSAAYAINSSGLAVGESFTPNSNYYNLPALWYHATVFSTAGAAPIDLGTLGGTNSRAWDINDHGVIVGQSQLYGGSLDPFIWSSGVMTSLNSLIDPASGWSLYDARAINNSGQIAVLGYNSRGDVHALLLNPLNGNVIPEPETLLLVLVGLGLLGVNVNRKRVKSGASCL